jgi:hydroxymethylpyrimidine/phosphomethylpyrimidine kinase
VTGRQKHPTVACALSIAGSDSGGGAGIQADLNTFGAFGVFGTTAITAVTVQNTLGISGFEELSPRTVAEQVRAVAEDFGVDAAKTGMLASAPIAVAAADAVAAAGIPALVVDPVFVSKHGHRLLAENAVASLRERILPLATLVTPNLPEAAALTGVEVTSKDDMLRAAERLLELGAGAALVKGGHLDSPAAEDLFLDGDRREWLSKERIPTPNTHGTGCVLSAAITASLALGDELLVAVHTGKEFITQAIRHSLAIGGGIGPVDPLWRRRALRGRDAGTRPS